MTRINYFHARWIGALCTVFFFSAPQLQSVAKAEEPVHCGVERWAIKTLNDPRANNINFSPEKRTVAALINLPAVIPGRDELRRDDELHTYRVECEIVKYKLEDDGDIHCVIQDPRDPASHMVAEIPNPECPDAIAGGYAKKFSDARETFIALCGEHPPKPRMQSINPPLHVIITGVGFYDFPHNQTGMAPNNLEIHPVLTVNGKR